MTPGRSRERELAHRLEEAEATIQALLSGQVDAVVDTDSGSPLLLAKAQGALRDSEERYRRILETTKEGVWLTDATGATTFMNGSMAEMLGCSADSCLGKRHADFLDAAEALRFSKYLGSLGSAPLELRFTRADGTSAWTLLRAVAVLTPDGTSDGTLSMVSDVSERRNSALALRREQVRAQQYLETADTAEERMRFALRSTNIGLWEQDFRTGAVQWSEILEAQYGLAPGAFDGRSETWFAMIHPEDRDTTIATMGAAMRTGGDFTLEHRAVRPDGSIRFLSGAGHIVLDGDGQPLRAVGISQDVTDRENLERQYQQSQKMEAIGQLAGGIAHDFNNILSVILTCGEFLLADLAPQDPSRVDADEIVIAARRAADLTRQLLMFSRKQVLAPRVIDLSVIGESMSGMLRRVVGEDVAIKFRHGDGLGRVRADPGSIEQVILNLVVNARDAMPTGGTITIETRNETVNVSPGSWLTPLDTPAGPYVVLAVTDSGVGMDEVTQRHAFEPFYTTKPIGKGTGLGLSTVFGIVQQNHGVIRLRSQLGQGTTFSVYLPRVDAPTDRVLSHPVAGARGSETILLVEDEDQVRTVARTILERHGYRIIEKRTAADALLHCRHVSTHIDMLLTDVVMPLMGGPELGRHVVEILPHVRVLCMSGYTDDSVIRHGVMHGATAFLQKPFTITTLTQKVREVLDGAIA